VRAAEPAILIEIPRNAALKLMATVPPPSAPSPASRPSACCCRCSARPHVEDLVEVLETAEIKQLSAGDSIIKEGEEGYDVFVIRQGSMVVEKNIGGKPVFLSYLPAGSYVGEMALIDGGRRTATVRAAIKSRSSAGRHCLQAAAGSQAGPVQQGQKGNGLREALNSFIEAKKTASATVVDMYSSVASFLLENGIGEATDVLLIDENLCVGCDNCEKACADSHEGLSRLNREPGRTFAHLHVPTSCRHCEHPHCMADCPPNAIHRGPDGEVFIDDTCIGCGNCQRNCPYGVIRLDKVPPKKPGLLAWLLAASDRARASRRRSGRRSACPPKRPKRRSSATCAPVSSAVRRAFVPARRGLRSASRRRSS
jgi:Fe-S-cluster-containing dehydrogenase component